jgi:hypothetical protein
LIKHIVENCPNLWRLSLSYQGGPIKRSMTRGNQHEVFLSEISHLTKLQSFALDSEENVNGILVGVTSQIGPHLIELCMISKHLNALTVTTIIRDKPNLRKLTLSVLACNCCTRLGHDEGLLLDDRLLAQLGHHLPDLLELVFVDACKHQNPNYALFATCNPDYSLSSSTSQHHRRSHISDLGISSLFMPHLTKLKLPHLKCTLTNGTGSVADDGRWWSNSVTDLQFMMFINMSPK